MKTGAPIGRSYQSPSRDRLSKPPTDPVPQKAEAGSPRKGKKRRLSVTTFGLDGTADRDSSEAPIDMSSSESFLQSADEIEEEAESPPSDRLHDNYENPQKRGWKTRYANMAKGKYGAAGPYKRKEKVRRSAKSNGEEVAENAQKRGWKTRHANMAKRAFEEDEAGPIVGKENNKWVEELIRGCLKRHEESPQKRGWRTRHANMAKRSGALAAKDD